MFTKHAETRMNQRGISAKLVRLAQRHGRVVGDRLVLDVKELRSVLDELDLERRTVIKAIDKGGLVVVEDENAVITTYNITDRVQR